MFQPWFTFKIVFVERAAVPLPVHGGAAEHAQARAYREIGIDVRTCRFRLVKRLNVFIESRAAGLDNAYGARIADEFARDGNAGGPGADDAKVRAYGMAFLEFARVQDHVPGIPGIASPRRMNVLQLRV